MIIFPNIVVHILHLLPLIFQDELSTPFAILSHSPTSYSVGPDLMTNIMNLGKAMLHTI